MSLRGRPVERAIAADGGAVHAADVGQVVAAASLVGETAVVPDDQVAVVPTMAIVKARLQHDGKQLVEQGLRHAWGDPSKITLELVDRAIELTQREGNRRALIERFSHRQPGTLAKRIPELKLPTLIIWGGRDRLVPVEAAHRLHRDIVGSTLAIFDDLGHAPEEEDPARTVEAVKRFLHL